MALPKFTPDRNDASPVVAARPRPRVAGEDDVAIGSPVHALHAALGSGLAGGAELPEPYVPHYPGWFRLGFPVVSSIVLWGAIGWVVAALR